MGRLTNQQIIGKLFPILKKALLQVPKQFDAKDFYGHPYSETVIDGHRVVYTEWSRDHITVEVVMPLEGKFDHATVCAVIRNGEVISYEYAKEFRGLGNGFYAELDENGKIIKSEWD